MTIDHIALARKRLAELEKALEAAAELVKAYSDKQNEIEGDILAIEMFLNTAAELEGCPWPDDLEQST